MFKNIIEYIFIKQNDLGFFFDVQILNYWDLIYYYVYFINVLYYILLYMYIQVFIFLFGNINIEKLFVDMFENYGVFKVRFNYFKKLKVFLLNINMGQNVFYIDQINVQLF